MYQGRRYHKPMTAAERRHEVELMESLMLRPLSSAMPKPPVPSEVTHGQAARRRAIPFTSHFSNMKSLQKL